MDVEKEIELIKKRNRKVEKEKAWETSTFRVVLLTLITYVITSIVFYFIEVKNFLFSALIPTVSYYLSTQSLPFAKKWWIEKYNKKSSTNQ